MPDTHLGDPIPTADGLLTLAFTGDEVAATRLFEQYSRWLLRLSRRRAPDLPNDLHEEVVQEMWSLVFSRGLAACLAAHTSADAYLTQVHRNAVESVRAAYRPAGSRSRYVRVSDSEAVANPLSHGDRTSEPTAARHSHLGYEQQASGDGVEDQSMWSNTYARVDFQMDLERLVGTVDDDLGRAITLITTDGSSITEAATRVGMSRQTLSRKLHQLAV